MSRSQIFDDNEKPVAVDYDIKVPNYAQRTGKRLFFQPVYFEYGVAPVFSAATRNYGVYFSYPWSEEDTVEIKLPGNFTGESVISPSIGRRPGWGRLAACVVLHS